MPSGGHDNLVGIDLGTTLSVIARLDKSGSAVTTPNRRGDPLTPSVVYWDGTTARVGETARIAAASDSSKAAVSVKREMGTSLYSRTVDGRRLRPETLSAIILRKLKQDAERRIGPIAKADDGELTLAENLKRELRDVEPIAVNAHSLGVVAIYEGERIHAVLISKNTQLPSAASQIFETRYASATAIRCPACKHVFTP